MDSILEIREFLDDKGLPFRHEITDVQREMKSALKAVEQKISEEDDNEDSQDGDSKLKKLKELKKSIEDSMNQKMEDALDDDLNLIKDLASIPDIEVISSNNDWIDVLERMEARVEVSVTKINSPKGSSPYKQKDSGWKAGFLKASTLIPPSKSKSDTDEERSSSNVLQDKKSIPQNKAFSGNIIEKFP